jgi:hypothetical protein
LFSIKNNNPKLGGKNRLKEWFFLGKIEDRKLFKEGLEVVFGNKMMMYL